MSKVACVVISLLLGIIIGLAAVVGGVFLVLSINVDTVLGWFGLDDANIDEEGNYIYIAGDQSLLQTINDTIDFFSNLDTSNLRGLNDFLPAVGLAVDSVADSLREGTGIELDVDGLMDCPISDLGDWLNEWVKEIQLYPVVEALLPSYLEGDDVMTVIVKSLVLGAEADVYVDDYGNMYPVYYYVAEKTDTGETDEDGEAVYAEVYAYYYIGDDGTGHVLRTDRYGNYVATDETYDYGAEPVCTGDYYAYEVEDGYEYVIINPVVLGDFYDSENLSESIYRISLGDIMTDDDNVITELFGDYTIGDLVDGSFDLNDFAIAAFVDMKPGEDDTLISLLYGVTEIVEKDGVWTCKYTDDDGNTHECVMKLDSNEYIDRIYYYETDGNGDPAYDEYGDPIEIEVEGVTLGNVTSLVDNLELVTVMGYPEVDDALMIYILFGVTDVYQDGDGNYRGTYVVNGENRDVILSVTDSDGTEKVMSSSYDDDEGKRQSTATTLNDVGDVVSDVTNALSVADFLSDVDPEEALFLYICYSVYDVTGPFTDGNEKDYYKGYLRTDDGETSVKIYVKTTGDGDVSVDYISYTVTNDSGNEEEVRVKGTKINEISGILNGLMSDLTLDVFLGDTAAENNALMVYLTYSLTGVTCDGDVWTAVYHYTYTDTDASGNETEVSASVRVILDTVYDEEAEKYYITGIRGVADGEDATNLGDQRIRGTTIDGISDQIDGLMNDVPIKDIVELGEDDDNIILNALGDATIKTLGQAIDDITVQSLFVDDVYQSTVTLFATYDACGCSCNGSCECSCEGSCECSCEGSCECSCEGSCGGSLSYVYGNENFDYGNYTFYYRTVSYVYDGECECCTDASCNCDCGCECDESCGETCTCKCECRFTGYYYVYNELKYYYNDEETPISSADNLLTAIKDYNSKDSNTEKITAVYIYTTNLKKVATLNTGYYGDEYYKVGCDGEYVIEDGHYVENYYIGFNENYIYYTMNGDGELVLYEGTSNEKGKVTATEFCELTCAGVELYTYGEVGGVWKFMLCERKDGEYYETLCSINDMGNLMTTTSENLSSATLNEFREIGILASDDETLGTEVVVDGVTKTLGDLTLDEMLSLMSSILSGTYTLPSNP